MFEKVSTLTIAAISSRGIRICCCCKICIDLARVSIIDHQYNEPENIPLNMYENDRHHYGLNHNYDDHFIEEDDYRYRHQSFRPHQRYPSGVGDYLLNERNENFCEELCFLCMRQCITRLYPPRHNNTEQQQRRNKQYYREKLMEDLGVISRQCHLVIGIIQLLAGMIILATYICAELILAKLVFKQTNTTDINSLLALLPTVVFSIFTWFGRGLIFDVTEDIKELSIPYFKKKETTEEKILGAIIALKDIIIAIKERTQEPDMQPTTEERILQEITALKEEIQGGIRIKQEQERSASLSVAGEVVALSVQVNNEDNTSGPEVTEMTERENENGNVNGEATERDTLHGNKQATGNNKVIEVEVHESVDEENLRGQNDILAQTPKLFLAGPDNIIA